LPGAPGRAPVDPTGTGGIVTAGAATGADLGAGAPGSGSPAAGALIEGGGAGGGGRVLSAGGSSLPAALAPAGATSKIASTKPKTSSDPRLDWLRKWGVPILPPRRSMTTRSNRIGGICPSARRKPIQ